MSDTPPHLSGDEQRHKAPNLPFSTDGQVDNLVIHFGIGGNSKQYEESGWSEAEPGFTWSLGNKSVLRLPIRNWSAGSAIIVVGCPLLAFPTCGAQRIRMTLGDDFLGEIYAKGDIVYVLPLDSQPDLSSDLKLTAQYLDATTPELLGIGHDERMLAFAWKSVYMSTMMDIAGITESLQVGAYGATELDSTSVVLSSWVARELLAWGTQPVRRMKTEFEFARLNATTYWSAIYRFQDQGVKLVPKPFYVSEDNEILRRSKAYLTFFEDVVAYLPKLFDATVCLCVADFVPEDADTPFFDQTVPVFAFQKRLGENMILLPDVDFLGCQFYEDEYYLDHLSYYDKVNSAVFCGSTSGGDISEQIAMTCSLPRLEAARFFDANERVDFRLPRIVQCVTPAAKATLASFPFTQRPQMSWQEQFSSRFLISIDGNGATCSRVAVALGSMSVLLKYESPHLLYYFSALEPGRHYLPVTTHRDIDDFIAISDADEGRYFYIAQHGRDFQREFLTRARVMEYTALLLQNYSSQCFVE